MEETTVLIITISATLLGTLIGALFPFISSIQDRKLRKSELEEDKIRKENSSIKNKYNKLCDQYATFYKLEMLYIMEIQRLRKDNKIENEIDGIRNQFRKEVYQQEVARIEFNDNSIIAQKFNLEK